MQNRILTLFCLIQLSIGTKAQHGTLEKAFEALLNDPQMSHGLASLYVADAQSGAVVFNRNGQIGLPPASAQKVVTAATALDILGKGYRYQTVFGYTDTIVGGTLLGQVVVRGSGDPTFGSPRYSATKAASIKSALRSSMQSLGIKQLEGGLLGIIPDQESLTIPRGWIWEDIANYYGAGHASFNWTENQFDVLLKPGDAAGKPVQIAGSGLVDYESQLASANDALLRPGTSAGSNTRIANELRSGPAGSGDNAFLFFNPESGGYTLRGTVPCCVEKFRISGAVSDPDNWTLHAIASLAGIKGPIQTRHTRGQGLSFPFKPLHVHRSPAMDSIVYWFLQKSINMYGEALVHTIAKQKSGFAAYDDGINIIRKFWSERGIDTAALNILDGSGLSPQNRVTAKALTQVMLYAKQRPWYTVFYEALPVYNGIKMKSGTIGGAKTYTGYILSASGKEYAFAIMVNNFSGKSADINRKIFAVLDMLK